ncbi:hypothetical protein A3Q56_04420 [Intoshia linei]|uniref:Protein kinase domain-containing protein n=1 Tax=Intoshia linei TaxID=1819745 RepID=A0A177B288_9BILA|nr:hypothetical protein A3Q56_04420 [Intoshia linei]
MTTAKEIKFKIKCFENTIIEENTTINVVVQDLISKIMIQRFGNSSNEHFQSYFRIKFTHCAGSEKYWLDNILPLSQIFTNYDIQSINLNDFIFELNVRFISSDINSLLLKQPIVCNCFIEQCFNIFLTEKSKVVPSTTIFNVAVLEIRRITYYKYHKIKKYSIKAIIKSVEIEKYLPEHILNEQKIKKIKKLILQQYIKVSNITIVECINQIYDILKSVWFCTEENFTAKIEKNNIMENGMLLIGPHSCISYITQKWEKHFLSQITDVSKIVVYKHEDGYFMNVELKSEYFLYLYFKNKHTIIAVVTLIEGYISFSLHHAVELWDRKISQTDSHKSVHVSFNDDEESEDDYSALVDELITFKNVEKYNLIGKGHFSQVYKGVVRLKNIETDVAIKEFKIDLAEGDDVMVSFNKELEIMKAMQHPNIVKLLGVLKSPPSIIIELAKCGQFRNYLIKNGKDMTTIMYLQYIYQVCSALSYLESKKIVHRDIACRNVLVFSKDLIKLSDFGMSRLLDNTNLYSLTRSNVKLPVKWMAPESIAYLIFSSESDVWMFGVYCWETFMNGEKPFANVPNNEILDILSGDERLPLPSKNCPPNFYNLLCHCWLFEPNDRPKFYQMKEIIWEILSEEKSLKLGDNYFKPVKSEYKDKILQHPKNSPLPIQIEIKPDGLALFKKEDGTIDKSKMIKINSEADTKSIDKKEFDDSFDNSETPIMIKKVEIKPCYKSVIQIILNVKIINNLENHHNSLDEIYQKIMEISTHFEVIEKLNTDLFQKRYKRQFKIIFKVTSGVNMVATNIMEMTNSYRAAVKNRHNTLCSNFIDDVHKNGRILAFNAKNLYDEMVKFVAQ